MAWPPCHAMASIRKEKMGSKKFNTVSVWQKGGWSKAIWVVPKYKDHFSKTGFRMKNKYLEYILTLYIRIVLIPSSTLSPMHIWTIRMYVWSRNEHARTRLISIVNREMALKSMSAHCYTPTRRPIVTICMSFDFYELGFWISKTSLLHHTLSAVFSAKSKQK